MQEGMRIKSKDIHYGISIFYLAINWFIGLFTNTEDESGRKLFSSRLVYIIVF